MSSIHLVAYKRQDDESPSHVSPAKDMDDAFYQAWNLDGMAFETVHVEYREARGLGDFVHIIDVRGGVYRPKLRDEEVELQFDYDRRTEAYMRACERDSPNSFGFDALVESIYEQLCEEGWHP